MILHQSQPFDLISEEDKLRLPDHIEDAYPVTMLQAGMIYHREYSPKSAIYHDISSFHLKAPLNVKVLQMAVQQLVIVTLYCAHRLISPISVSRYS